MDLLAPVRVFDRFSRRHRPLALAIAGTAQHTSGRSGNSEKKA